jgi:hypothetical protein
MYLLLISYFLECKVVCVCVCLREILNIICSLDVKLCVYLILCSKHNFTRQDDLYEKKHNVTLFCEI